MDSKTDKSEPEITLNKDNKLEIKPIVETENPTTNKDSLEYKKIDLGVLISEIKLFEQRKHEINFLVKNREMPNAKTEYELVRYRINIINYLKITSSYLKIWFIF